ncbi:MAG: hypothetical protein KatS3mg096_804 [Candidatus Parcubacteria bacterium]|nr:MAG: hypothetical protein KatS3mg096_804 [Candidatus Parcubacteria bacterium]
MKKDNFNTKVIQFLEQERPVIFYPPLVRMLGSIEAGLFLSRLICWNNENAYFNKGKAEWFSKTINEVKEELGLSRWEQEKVIKTLKKLSLIETKVMGLPPRRYFRVRLDKLLEFLIKNSNLQKINK